MRSTCPAAAGGGKRRVRLLDLDQHMLALELHASVAKHRARQQACFEQYLETVADSEHRAAGLRELLHLGHDRREARDRAGAQVVAVGEAAGQND